MQRNLPAFVAPTAGKIQAVARMKIVHALSCHESSYRLTAA
jgi:hypothetical protein